MIPIRRGLDDWCFKSLTGKIIAGRGTVTSEGRAAALADNTPTPDLPEERRLPADEIAAKAREAAAALPAAGHPCAILDSDTEFTALTKLQALHPGTGPPRGSVRGTESRCGTALVFQDLDRTLAEHWAKWPPQAQRQVLEALEASPQASKNQDKGTEEQPSDAASSKGDEPTKLPAEEPSPSPDSACMTL